MISNIEEGHVFTFEGINGASVRVTINKIVANHTLYGGIAESTVSYTHEFIRDGEVQSSEKRTAGAREFRYSPLS